MKRIVMITSLIGFVSLSACSNEKTGVTNEPGTTESAAQIDSATTNPINSEYGTPNASENPVDSAQQADKNKAD